MTTDASGLNATQGLPYMPYMLLAFACYHVHLYGVSMAVPFQMGGWHLECTVQHCST